MKVEKWAEKLEKLRWNRARDQMNFSPCNKICTTITACLFTPSVSKVHSSHSTANVMPTNTQQITACRNAAIGELLLMSNVIFYGYVIILQQKCRTQIRLRPQQPLKDRKLAIDFFLACYIFCQLTLITLQKQKDSSSVCTVTWYGVKRFINVGCLHYDVD